MARIASIFLIFILSLSGFPVASKERPLVRRLWGTVLKRNSFTNRLPFQFARPVISGEDLFVGVHHGFFYSLDKNNGRRRWKIKTQGGIQMEAALDATHLYVGDIKGNLYSLKKENGDLVWVTDLGGEILSKPWVGEGVVYAVTMEQELFALELETGKILWQLKHDLDPRQFTIHKMTDLVLHNGEVLIGFSDGTLNAYHPQNGKLLWSRPIGDPFEPFHDQDATVTFHDGKGIVSSAEGHLVVFDLNNWQAIWESDVGGLNQSAAVENRLYVSSGGILRLLNLENGQLLWEQDFDVPSISAPALYENWVVIATSKGKIFVLDRKTGDVVFDWYIRGGALSDPVVEGKRVYILSNAARVYAFQFRE